MATIEVSDELIAEMGDKWSEPVQFKFLRYPDGSYDLQVRNVSWATLRSPSGPVAATRETR